MRSGSAIPLWYAPRDFGCRRFYGAAFAHASMAGGVVPRFDAEALSIPAMLSALGQGRATPAIVIASLLEEMRRESASEAFAAAAGALG